MNENMGVWRLRVASVLSQLRAKEEEEEEEEETLCHLWTF
jgi:hypothetical protein